MSLAQWEICVAPRCAFLYLYNDSNSLGQPSSAMPLDLDRMVFLKPEIGCEYLAGGSAFKRPRRENYTRYGLRPA